jgi:hypothetical protein
MQDFHLEILLSVLQDSCKEGKVVPRSVLFSKFENIARSGLEIDKFKRSLSYCINNVKISGYKIRHGRGGGVYKVSETEKVTIICYSGKFTGQIPSKTLNRLIVGLKKQTKNGK